MTATERACASKWFARGNNAIIGISPGVRDEIYGGYDETLWMRDNEHFTMDAAERVALAEQMIALWQERRAQWAREKK